MKSPRQATICFFLACVQTLGGLLQGSHLPAHIIGALSACVYICVYACLFMGHSAPLVVVTPAQRLAVPLCWQTSGPRFEGQCGQSASHVFYGGGYCGGTVAASITSNYKKQDICIYIYTHIDAKTDICIHINNVFDYCLYKFTSLSLIPDIALVSGTSRTYQVNM